MLEPTVEATQIGTRLCHLKGCSVNAMTVAVAQGRGSGGVRTVVACTVASPGASIRGRWPEWGYRPARVDVYWRNSDPRVGHGTLLKAEPNHPLLAVPEGRLIMAEARTEPKYELCDLNAIPGIVCAGVGAVIGIYGVREATLAARRPAGGPPAFCMRSRIGFEEGTIVAAYLLAREQVLGRPDYPVGRLASTRRDRARVLGFDRNGEAGQGSRAANEPSLASYSRASSSWLAPSTSPPAHQLNTAAARSKLR